MDRRGLFDDRAYWKQAVALQRRGAEIFYLVIDYYDETEQDKNLQTSNEGIHYQIFKARKYVSNLLMNYAIKKILNPPNEFHEMLEMVEKIQPDLIQIVDLRILRLLPKLLKIKSRPKIVYDIREPRDHNLLELRMKDWKLPLKAKKWYANSVQNWEYRNAAKCDFILGVDDGIARRIAKNLPDKPYKTIYNFTNLSDQRQHIPLDKRNYDAAYVGALSELRGTKTIAHATEILVRKMPSVKILLLGKAFPEELNQWIHNFIKEKNLENNLTHINGVDFQEVSKFYNQIKIGLNPLHHVKAHEEIIQIKLFEYMNYGMPIITSNFGEMMQYVIDNQCGETIPPDDPEALANTIFQLLQHPEKMEYYAQNGMHAVDEKFNWKLMEKEYVDIINSLIIE